MNNAYSKGHEMITFFDRIGVHFSGTFLLPPWLQLKLNNSVFDGSSAERYPAAFLMPWKCVRDPLQEHYT